MISIPFRLVRASSALALAFLSSAPALAQAIPDAGQTQRELQRQPVAPPPQAVDPLRIEQETARPGPAGAAGRIAIRSVVITGNSVFSDAELQALVADLPGGERSLNDLDRAAARITARYREQGYAVARAYVPAQEIKEGKLEIRVLEGRIDQYRANNQSRLSDATARAYLDRPKSGELVRSDSIDRVLLLLNDTPGVAAARGSLQPGASVGTSELLVQLDPASPYSAGAELDNYGNRYVGEYRVGGSLALNSPLRIGDLFSLRAVSSGQGMDYGRVAYQLPLGGNGLKVGAAYSYTSYRLGKDFSILQAHGTAENASLFLTYPLLRRLYSSLTGALTVENKRFRDRMDAVDLSTDKQVNLIAFGLAGSHQDALGGGGIAGFDLSLANGRLRLDALSKAVDAATARSGGDFTRLSYTAYRLQNLGGDYSLSATLTGQWASKNLYSSEKFWLGGANGVRAYPQGEGSGDEGWMANLELRRRLFDGVQGALFYDVGSVRINHQAFAAGSNTRTLAGVGLGVTASLNYVQLKAAVAWRTEGGAPTSEPASASHIPRFWLQLNVPL